MSSPPFHLAFPVTDLEAARRFYVELLGARVGRESGRWIDFDFFGHQITAHLIDAPETDVATNRVDGKEVPVRHFGAVLEWQAWHALRDRLRAAVLKSLGWRLHRVWSTDWWQDPEGETASIIATLDEIRAGLAEPEPDDDAPELEPNADDTAEVAEAYEILMHDVLIGDGTLFSRSDEVEESWRIVDPILEAWKDRVSINRYRAGTFDVPEMDELMKGCVGSWYRPAAHE